MAEMLSALTAQDTEKDVTLTDPGTGSHLPGLPDLVQMFDRQIETLGRLKEQALTVEKRSSERTQALEKENRDLQLKNIEKDKVIMKLKQELSKGETPSSERPNGQHTGSDEKSSEHWRMKYEEMRRQCEETRRQCDELLWERQNSANGAGGDATAETQPVNADHWLFLSEKIDIKSVKYLLRRLSIPENEIANLGHSNPDPRDFCITGLATWKNREGTKATVGAVVKGLVKCSLRSVAEDFCREHALHGLLQKVDQEIQGDAVSPQTEAAPPMLSPRSPPRSLEDMPDIGRLSLEPQYVPKSALEKVLWPNLLNQNGVDDLHEELNDTAPFTAERFDKFFKKLELKTEKEKEVLTKATGQLESRAVLDAWAQVQLLRISDEANIPALRSALGKLGKWLRRLEKTDVRKVLLAHLHSGLLGPSVDDKTLLRDKVISYTSFTKIGRQLSVQQGNSAGTWQCFASFCEYDEYIPIWALDRSKLPGQTVLETWKTGKDASVGKFYAWAVSVNRTDITKLLEGDLSAR